MTAAVRKRAPQLGDVAEVEIALYMNDARTRWIAHCAVFNCTAWRWTREGAVEELRRELDREEDALSEMPPASPSTGVPRGAERRTIRRNADGRWAS